MKAYTDIVNEFGDKCGYIEKISLTTWGVFLYRQYKGEMTERKVRTLLNKLSLYLL